MGAIGIVIKNGLELANLLPQKRKDPWISQQKMLKRLLTRAEFTIFGQEYHFSKILRSHDMVAEFQKNVPIHTYEAMLHWWKMTMEGEDSVCWPGKVDHFALSSGTTAGASKYIPITKSMLRAMQKASIKQISALAHCDLPESFFEKGILMLGGSTNLEYNGIFYAGDLSGITTGNLPFWFQPYYKPGKDIAKTRNWQEKLDMIIREAHKWDIGAIAGAPSWFQILIERIIDHYKVKNIHEIWPNLAVFTHGAVAFEPYKKSFEALLGKPLIYLETYLASEGFIAYQAHPEAEGMRMLVRTGIFFEFVPFNDDNFDNDGNIKPNAQALTINQVEEGVDYALLMSTVAGAWRYVIGDVIHFTSKKNYEIKISGRTKHYLSLCGEHLSVENMNRAVELVSEEFNVRIREFTVYGEPHGNLFGHHWLIAVDGDVDKEQLRKRIDYHLGVLNDDYRVERQHVLQEMKLDLVPNDLFLGWLQSQGKEGAQVKFPRVLKGAQIESFRSYIKAQGVEVSV